MCKCLKDTQGPWFHVTLDSKPAIALQSVGTILVARHVDPAGIENNIKLYNCLSWKSVCKKRHIRSKANGYEGDTFSASSSAQNMGQKKLTKTISQFVLACTCFFMELTFCSWSYKSFISVTCSVLLYFRWMHKGSLVLVNSRNGFDRKRSSRWYFSRSNWSWSWSWS